MASRRDSAAQDDERATDRGNGDPREEHDEVTGNEREEQEGGHRHGLEWHCERRHGEGQQAGRSSEDEVPCVFAHRHRIPTGDARFLKQGGFG
jgi:hypothetical protein